MAGWARFIGSHVVRLFVNKYPEYNRRKYIITDKYYRYASYNLSSRNG